MAGGVLKPRSIRSYRSLSRGLAPAFLSVVLCFASLGALASSAGAATIPVNTTADEFAANAAACSLREALQNANLNNAGSPGCTAGSGADTIVLPAGVYTLTRAGAGENANATGDLDTAGAADTTIANVGKDQVVIDGGGLDRVIHHLATANLAIQGITIRGGGIPGVNDGGGIQNGGGSRLTLDSVTLTGNFAGSEAGGLANYGLATLNNTTISGNRANGSGGGIYTPGGASTTLNNSTIAANVADAEANGNGDGGGISAAAGTYNIKNTLIGDNVDNGGQQPDCSTGPNLFRFGYNLIERVSTNCLFAPGDDATGFISGQDPKLGPLGDNGGPVLTHALLAGSPALNTGSPGGTSACLTNDARGVQRSVGGRCDIGAYERVECKGIAANRIGGEGPDTVTGTIGDDAFLLLGGNDIATGMAGADVFCGGDGNDKLRGNGGKDKLFGDGGKDRLKGQGGRDQLKGNGGKDRLRGNGGNDKLRGNAGKDNLKGGGGKDNVKGNAGKDTINGGGRNDVLKGNGGNDVLKGKSGKDTLKGGGGKDTLNGGGGNDTCKGGGKTDSASGCEVERGIP